VPAALYAVNNYLKFSMQLWFHPTSAKMLGNLKILTIALLMRSVMCRKFNVIQVHAHGVRGGCTTKLSCLWSQAFIIAGRTGRLGWAHLNYRPLRWQEKCPALRNTRPRRRCTHSLTRLAKCTHAIDNSTHKKKIAI
jgi:hypothetical protein